MRGSRTKGSILGTLEENMERLIRNLEMAGVELDDEEDEGESGHGVLGEASDEKKESCRGMKMIGIDRDGRPRKEHDL
jgi:hypothetical protein